MRKSKIALVGRGSNPPPMASQKQPLAGNSIEAMNSLTRVKCEPPRLYETATGAPLDFYNEFTEHLWGEIGISYKRNTIIAMERGGRVFVEFLYETGALSGRLDPVTASNTMHLFSSYLIEGAEAKDPIVRS